ncbi:MAG TPA: ribonuclease HII [Stellaceae bacterium]|nr:ribonuclease HII [Stellaceae bacterium]
MPSFRYERALDGIVCGIDEVGRAPLAGPVLAAAVILPAKLPRALQGMDDSKVVPRERREEFAERLFDHAKIGIGAASVAEIDTINILRATFLAMSRAVAALSAVLGETPAWALVDGNQAPKLPCRVQTIVGGDGKSLSIAAASIVAKVTRDRLMHALAPRYPGYGWETNVGYPTKIHRDAILSRGITPHHRKRFVHIQGSLDLELASESNTAN